MIEANSTKRIDCTHSCMQPHCTILLQPTPDLHESWRAGEFLLQKTSSRGRGHYLVSIRFFFCNGDDPVDGAHCQAGRASLREATNGSARMRTQHQPLLPHQHRPDVGVHGGDVVLLRSERGEGERDGGGDVEGGAGEGVGALRLSGGARAGERGDEPDGDRPQQRRGAGRERVVRAHHGAAGRRGAAQPALPQVPAAGAPRRHPRRRPVAHAPGHHARLRRARPRLRHVAPPLGRPRRRPIPLQPHVARPRRPPPLPPPTRPLHAPRAHPPHPNLPPPGVSQTRLPPSPNLLHHLHRRRITVRPPHRLRKPHHQDCAILGGGFGGVEEEGDGGGVGGEEGEYVRGVGGACVAGEGEGDGGGAGERGGAVVVCGGHSGADGAGATGGVLWERDLLGVRAREVRGGAAGAAGGVRAGGAAGERARDGRVRALRDRLVGGIPRRAGAAERHLHHLVAEDAVLLHRLRVGHAPLRRPRRHAHGGVRGVPALPQAGRRPARHPLPGAPRHAQVPILRPSVALACCQDSKAVSSFFICVGEEYIYTI